MEVLISMFVLTIGLLGLAALIPLGRLAMVETGKADRSGACGHAALHELKVRRMLDYRSWYSGTPEPTWWEAVHHPTDPPGTPIGHLSGQTVPYLESFAIDPLGVAKGLPVNLGPVPRITLSYLAGNTALAESIFMWHDDLKFSLPEDMKPPPADDSDRPRADLDSSSGTLQFAGNYSWLVTVTPAAAEADLPVADKTLYSVSVVVCYRREFSVNEETRLPDGEHTAPVAEFYGEGWGGGSVRLDSVVEVRENEWIMLCGGRHCKWYRVASAGEMLIDPATGNPDPSGTPVTVLSLVGPDWTVDSDHDGNLDAQAVMIDHVVGVYTTTVEL